MLRLKKIREKSLDIFYWRKLDNEKLTVNQALIIFRKSFDNTRLNEKAASRLNALYLELLAQDRITLGLLWNIFLDNSIDNSSKEIAEEILGFYFMSELDRDDLSLTELWYIFNLSYTKFYFSRDDLPHFDGLGKAEVKLVERYMKMLNCHNLTIQELEDIYIRCQRFEDKRPCDKARCLICDKQSTNLDSLKKASNTYF